MDIVIIDYGAGNIQSIRFAFERLGYSPELSSDPSRILQADRVIFPGVGEASSAMAKLRHSGLDQWIPRLVQPVLGICLGMQLMCRYSEEGDTQGLGIFDTEVRRFPDSQKVPQIGWNRLTNLKSPIFNGIEDGAFVYLVHSYYAPLCDETAGVCDYGFPYSAALVKDNFFGLQFHPEKSSKAGAQMLQNFIEMTTP